MSVPRTRGGAAAGLVIVLAGQAMATMDGSIIAVAAPSLHASINASGAELQLVVAIYTMAFAATVVTGARLGDTLGRRRAFTSGLAAFTLASLVGGLAPNPSVLIGARALQGAAAALMTAQVLSIIQVQFEGERRARAIGAYSMILAVGVAAGQVLGGLLLSAHLTAAPWRPALLLNVPLGVLLIAGSLRALPATEAAARERLDVGGAALLAAALLALIAPLSLGREYGWPAWIWPCLGAFGLVAAAFVARERRLSAGDGRPLLELGLLRVPGLAGGVAAVLLIMACYSGFLLALTLHLQTALRFSPLHAGLIFATYASGFATASLTWTRFGAGARSRLPVIGPLVMGGALLAVGLAASGGGWPLGLSSPLLFAAGAGHAWGFSPLASRLTTLVRPAQAADLSGLVLTADFVGMVLGAAGFAGLYLSAAPDGSARALALTTAALTAALLICAACARSSLRPRLAPESVRRSGRARSPSATTAT
jgi:MFS family permease